MRKRFHSLKAWLASGLLLASFAADAQFNGAYPYPQGVQYLGGRKPTVSQATMNQDALDSYKTWKDKYVTSTNACGFRRVMFDYYKGTPRGAEDGSKTVSEGIGYGMLLAAYAGDESLFSDLWNYYKANTNGNVMNWQTQGCKNFTGQNGATDAELDVAIALYVASFQWQSNAYLTDAKNLVRAIRTTEVESGSFVLKPGDKFGGSSLLNISYFSPAYYRVFATFDTGNEAFWNSVTAKGYEILFKADENTSTKQAAERGNGLVPDWSDSNGNFSGAASGYEDGGKNFVFDAIRTPFRTALDLLWHGPTVAAQAQKYSTRITNFTYAKTNGDLVNIGAKYDVNGNVINQYKNNTFIGCFAIAAMAANPSQAAADLPASKYPKKTESEYQAFLDKAYSQNKVLQPATGEYFNASFKVLAQFIMSGNFYKPPLGNCTAPTLAQASLCKATSVVLDSKIAAGAKNSFVWKLNGNVIASATSPTYTATAAGLYEVIVNQDGCVRRASAEVLPATVAAGFTFNVQAGSVVFTNTSTGASGFTWSYKVAGGTTSTPFTTPTEANPTQAFPAGSYDVTLTANNTSFGCTGTNAITKRITAGSGAGWVADDFNDHRYSEPWLASDDGGATPVAAFKKLPTTWCSADDKKEGKDPVCSNLPCSYFRIEADGQANADFKYKPFGVNFRNNDAEVIADIDNVPFVSIKIKSTTDLSLGVGLGDATGLTTHRLFIELTAGKEEIINIDFSANKKGYLDAKNPNAPVDFKKIKQIAFFPFEANDAEYAGTIDIDWIIVGGKSLPSPQFNRKVDAQGLVVYENPNGDGETYVPVSSWAKKVVACATTTKIDVKACTAEEVRWYNGATQIGTGFTSPALAAGKYFVELINAGGITRDTVDVSTSNVVADFSVNQFNYGAKFINNSQSYHVFTWNYGDPANDEPASNGTPSTKWDVGYHNYKKALAGAASKEFTTSLTVTDTVCKVTKTAEKKILISCDHVVTKPVPLVADSAGCEGDVVKFVLEPQPNASEFGWFGPEGTTVTFGATDANKDSATVTFGNKPGVLKIEAYNDCPQAATAVNLAITPKPVSTFKDTVKAATVEFKADYGTVPATTYAWAFGDNGTADIASPTHKYAAIGTYNVCLTVSNACGSPAKACKDVKVTVLGLRESDAVGALKVYPTLTSNQLSVQLQGAAVIQIRDLTGNVLAEKSIVDNGAFQVAALPAGTYILSIQQGAETLNKQFIKQ